jgi:hypothetical protein
MSDIVSKIQEIQSGIGPKRVKTPQEEVEQFSLKELIDAANRIGAKKPSLNNIGWTRVVPKNNCACDSLTKGNCNDS